MTENKIVFKDEIRCPHCRKYIEVKRVKEVVQEAVKGIYEETTVVKKSRQTRLS